MRLSSLAILVAFGLTATTPAAAVIGVAELANAFAQPLYAAARGDTLYVAQQGGAIVAVDRTTGAKTPFFTVTGIESGGEKGLLGLAFDPGYAQNGRFYVDVTTRIGGQLYTEVRRYTDPAIATEATSVVIRVAQPFDNHNGGWIDFGPDGNLYVALGDGGSANDPFNNAQNLTSNLGKLLRLDVSSDAFPADAIRNYAIPATNPFGTEIFAYGLRNPFRDSFDSATGDLWIGDVGQGAREEVDRITAGTSGQNFGWRPREGFIPTPGVNEPTPAGAINPLLDYDHGIGQSITGGVVYHGSIDELDNRYVFGDFVTGKLFSAALDGSDFMDITGILTGFGGINPAAFGLDGFGNLYIVDYGGRVLKLFDGDTDAVPEPGVWALLIAGFAMVGFAARRRRDARLRA